MILYYLDTTNTTQLIYTDRNIYLNLSGTKKIALTLQPKRNILAIKKNTFSSNMYLFVLKIFLHLKIYFLKVETLFFDSKKIFLIAKTLSLRLPT